MCVVCVLPSRSTHSGVTYGQRQTDRQMMEECTFAAACLQGQREVHIISMCLWLTICEVCFYGLGRYHEVVSQNCSGIFRNVILHVM